MTTNITFFPLGDEFLRAYPSYDDDRITYVALYPVRMFRLKTSLLDEIIEKTLKTTEQSVKKELDDSYQFDFTAHVGGSGQFNYILNEELGKLYKSGDLLLAAPVANNTGNELNTLFDRQAFLTTCDGYTIFNPGFIPLAASGAFH